VAFHLLQGSPRTDEDPWLMAALLSVAHNGGITVSSLRPARRIIENGRYLPIERAELVSEVATFDLRAGTDRRARQLFNLSLATPTDNSLAQAEWASHRLANLSVSLSDVNVPYAAEAHARSAAQEGKWADALVEAVRWQRDQPFDAEAATFASYVASTGVEDFVVGERTAEAGLRARPDDPALLNNLAYAQIHLHKLKEAAETLKRAPGSLSDSNDAIALKATNGLLAFRLGEIDRGRSLYTEAIETAKRARQRAVESMARAMLASEELRAGLVEDIDALLRAVSAVAEGVDDPGVQVVLRRLELAAGMPRAR
jgi:tetratricopeptide (TPR) repeat protein